jgi:hypothetical protein
MNHDEPSGRLSRPKAVVPGPGALATGICLALAGLSLAVPYQLDGDAWSWIVWGREVRDLSLSTAGGSAWKPLPVLFTTVLSLLGDAAPALWLWLVRASWLGCLVLAYRVASRLSGRIAGLVAALGLLLIPSPGAGWLPYVLQGDSEPLIALAVLGAIESHLAGRRLLAAGLGTLAALGRPEAWPLLAVYAALQWRSSPRDRAVLVCLVAVVPALWLGGGLWGGGELFDSAQRARRGVDAARARGWPPVHILLLVYLSVVAKIVIAPLWIAGAGAVAAAVRRWRSGAQRAQAQVEVAMGAGVAAWIVIDVAGGATGLPAVPRFLFAPAAVVCVLGGSGIVRAWRAAAARGWELTAAGSLALALVATGSPRVRGLLPGLHEAAVPTEIGRAFGVALSETGAAGRIRSCGGEVVVGGAPPRAREAAWRLDLPLRDVRAVRRGQTIKIKRGLVIARSRRPSVGRAARGAGEVGAADASWQQVGSTGRWTVYEVGCWRR